MKLSYKLINDDYLEYQLFISSKSALHRKKRNRARFLIPIIYFTLGIIAFIAIKSVTTVFILATFGLLWLIFYPLYSKWRYKNHFKKHIENNYSNRINKVSKLEFGEKYIKSSDDLSSSKIKYDKISHLIELPSHFLLKLDIDMSIILPKREINDHNAFKDKILKLGIEYLDESHWEWK